MAASHGQTTETRPYVPWDLMHDFMCDAFVGYGVPREDAEICTDVLLEADRRGIESHGCNRFKPIYLDRIRRGTLLPTTQIEVLKETPTTLVIDAHDGMGMVASHYMMTRLIEKAKACGMAGGAIRNSTHYGIAGYWTNMASSQGLIGLTGTNARPSIAPTFGVENMMGTNPLTFSLPTDEDFPFCIDCATSIVQRGKIEYYARQGKPTPAGMVVGHDGKTMTDSEEILRALVAGEAALAPLGGVGEELAGYKGYGYAAVVEMTAARRCTTWATSSSWWIPRPSWAPMCSARRPATSAVHCAPPRRLRARSASTPPARRSTLSGSTARTRVCPWASRSNASSPPYATSWAWSTRSPLRDRRAGRGRR